MGLPYLLYVHGEEMRVASSSRQLTWMAHRVLAGASRLIVNSHNTAHVLRAEWNVAEDRISVLHPGVDAGRFAPAPRCALARQRLGWENRRVILTVGRLQRRKGQDMLIRALTTIREQIPDVLYVIVGDGEERGTLHQLVEDLGLHSHVQFRGEPTDDELIECYQQCDVFVLPNREVSGDFEGFGMVLIEAQACGKPVIAGASGGTAETMRLGETGLVVNCAGPDLVADKVAQLLQDDLLRTQMGLAARQWVLKHFDWPQLVAQAASTFQEFAACSVGRWPKANLATIPG